MDSEIFEKLPPTKLFFRCAIPSVITMAFGALYSIADGFFVGRFVGEDALAAINLIMPVIMMVFAISNMIATGASVRISVLLGEKNREDASAVFSFSLKLIFVISCIIGIIGYFFAEPFIRFVFDGATEAAVKYGITYLKVYAVFSPLLPIYFATDNYLRVCGKETLSMWLGVATQLLNIVLDVILIVFLGQGIWAAAFTSCVAMALGSVITLLLFLKKRMDLYYTRKGINFSRLISIIANGSSEFFSNSAMSVMSIVHNVFLLRYGGTIAVAAMSVVYYADSIIGMMLFGMCDALQPAISYCYGAGNIKKVKAIFNRVLVAAAILSAISMLFLFFAGRYVAKIFVMDGDIELLEMSIVAMQIFSFSYLLGWVDMCLSSFFTALEMPIRSLLCSFFGTLVFPIAFLYILSYFFGLYGLWWMPTAACTAGAIFAVALWLTVKKSLSGMK